MTNHTTPDRKALETFLQALPPGPIEDRATLIQRLTAVWDQLSGSSDQQTTTNKLYRLEEPVWEPPQTLRFRLERHGGTVLGSTRADVHVWAVDIATGTARIEKRTYRQLIPRDKPLKVKPLADAVAKAILFNLDHPAVQRRPNQTVKIDIGLLIPSTNQATTAGRRKRFRKALAEQLAEYRWTEYQANYWHLN